MKDNKKNISRASWEHNIDTYTHGYEGPFYKVLAGLFIAFIITAVFVTLWIDQQQMEREIHVQQMLNKACEAERMWLEIKLAE